MMRIINESVREDLTNGVDLKIDLGCGSRPKKGYYSLDLLEMNGVDIVADLNQPLDMLPDNSCSHIFSNHVFEHIHDLNVLMGEIYRIAKPCANLEIVVPHFSNVFGYSDPTHVRLFGIYSFYYYVRRCDQPGKRKVPDFYTSYKYRVHKITIEFSRLSLLDRLLVPIMRKLVNINLPTQTFYERRLSAIFHASQIRFHLQPVKG
jgi:SAM-dependent methyltransferase